MERLVEGEGEKGMGGSYYAGVWVDGAGESVDGYHVRGFVVPGTVFSPVCGGDFFPRVVVSAG